MKDVPPAMQAMVKGLQQKVQQLTQQLQVAAAAVADKQADRALDAQHYQQQFEAALLKVVSDTETKMAKVQEAATANWEAHIGSRLADLGSSVQRLEEALRNPPAAKPNGMEGQV
jgi:predicted pyridoxine 5'-phosphate oxidase superfamily flavin-nucleotide-binding protein